MGCSELLTCKAAVKVFLMSNILYGGNLTKSIYLKSWFSNNSKITPKVFYLTACNFCRYNLFFIFKYFCTEGRRRGEIGRYFIKI